MSHAETAVTRWAGYRAHSHRTDTGTLCVLVDNIAAGLDTSSGRWGLVCDDHDIAVAVERQVDARRFLSYPSNWCDVCQERADS